MTIRKPTQDDVAGIARIEAASPEAAQWGVQSYLAYDCLVCEDKEHFIAGFLAARLLTPTDEAEDASVTSGGAAGASGSASGTSEAESASSSEDYAERELLNLAVHPSKRRQGIARAMLQQALRRWPGIWFLEVRESNAAAIRLYQALGFHPCGRREQYYRDPPEAGIVMKFVS